MYFYKTYILVHNYPIFADVSIILQENQQLLRLFPINGMEAVLMVF